jgi:hypothetical protein
LLLRRETSLSRSLKEIPMQTHHAVPVGSGRELNVMQRAAAWWPWVRFQSPCRTRRWFCTPVTYRFGHGGWVYLSLAWLWRFRNGV